MYVPELNKTFTCPPNSFCLFACQNPLHQGGGRKGLPKSFLNRFTQVFVSPLDEADQTQIAKNMYPIAHPVLEKMIAFSLAIHQAVTVKRSFGRLAGDLNLRDVFRWCDLMVSHQQPG